MRLRVLAWSIGLLLTGPAAAGVQFPPGFTTQVYVSGQGYETGRGGHGVPATSTLVFDRSGYLYLARTGQRYLAAEIDDLASVYRIPPGGERVTADSEARVLHGPPLRNAQITAVRGGLELLVTTFDRDRRLGALYRMVDGRPTLLAGGTPPAGARPLLQQPEAVAVGSNGHLYVADRRAGRVVHLAPDGRVLNPDHVTVPRPRTLAIDAEDALWIGSDGDAEAPWQAGPGEIWRVPPGGPPALLLRGPMASGIALSPAGHLLVADRQGAAIFALTREGRRIPLASYGEGDAPRALAFAPDTPETRRLGMAGDLFVVTIRAGAWPVNEVIRVSGPFDDVVRQRAADSP